MFEKLFNKKQKGNKDSMKKMKEILEDMQSKKTTEEILVDNQNARELAEWRKNLSEEENMILNCHAHTIAEMLHIVHGIDLRKSDAIRGILAGVCNAVHQWEEKIKNEKKSVQKLNKCSKDGKETGDK